MTRHNAESVAALSKILPAARQSHLGMIGGSDIPSVLLMSSHNLILVAVAAENPVYKERMLDTEADFSVLLWPSQGILPLT